MNPWELLEMQILVPSRVWPEVRVSDGLPRGRCSRSADHSGTREVLVFTTQPRVATSIAF